MPEIHYVQRNEAGEVVGHFASKQPGLAEEPLPEDHADIAAYEERLDQARAAGGG